MESRIEILSEELAAICQRWQVVELALFGSVLRADFRPDSDVDVLVQFSDNARHTLLDLARLQEALRTLLGREVDLVEKAAIELSRNYLRRRAILESAETVYAA